MEPIDAGPTRGSDVWLAGRFAPASASILEVRLLERLEDERSLRWLSHLYTWVKFSVVPMCERTSLVRRSAEENDTGETWVPGRRNNIGDTPKEYQNTGRTIDVPCSGGLQLRTCPREESELHAQ